MDRTADIVVVGSGIGGATMAHGLAHTGARILILERGDQLADTPLARDDRAIFIDKAFRSKERWQDQEGARFSAANYYCVGGNSKFYGAVMLRYRVVDFLGRSLPGGDAVKWPFAYDELEPWYSLAEQLFQVRGQFGQDSTEPMHSAPYAFPPIADEAPVAVLRERLKAQGLHPFSLPLAVDIDRWLKRGQTGWDAFPDTRSGKIDAETGPLASALGSSNVSLETNARVVRIETDGAGKKITALTVESRGEVYKVAAGLVILAAGAINSAALLLRSANGAMPAGLANSSGQVGKNFMNHNSSVLLAIDPKLRNTSIYQKTFGINDYYLDDRGAGPALGNVQLLGKITGPILKANLSYAPEGFARLIANYAFGWYLMSEDLAHPNSRVLVDGKDIVLNWVRSNMEGHDLLVRRFRDVLKASGSPIVLTRELDRRFPSHQCGTVRMGNDPSTAPLDSYCRSYDHPNLYVVDGSFLPSSAAVNPSLTIAAQALRVADHIAKSL